MRAAAGVRRATLVITIGFLAAGTAMLIPACAVPAVPAAHDATSRPRATAGPAVRRQSRRASARPADPSAALAAALAPVARDHPGRLAVGVVDQTTGTTATCRAEPVGVLATRRRDLRFLCTAGLRAVEMTWEMVKSPLKVRYLLI